MKLKKSLKISEMARIAKLNTRTLHYYDEIGLFSPESKDENGYRYYAIEQLIDLGIILSLKELDMPLKEIKSVLASDIDTSKKILEKKRVELDEKIQHLTDVKRIIERKLHFFDLAKQNEEKIKMIDLKEEYLLLSKKIDEATSHNLIESAYELLVSEGKYLFANNEYGAMFHCQKKEMGSYDYFYLQTDNMNDCDFIKPAGRYLHYVYKGDDEGLLEAYDKINEYITNHQLKSEGYFYEKALNETTNFNQDEYITEIQIKVT